jgi:octaprenyl-diphosphate synthase
MELIKMSLREIIKPIHQDLKQFQKEFNNALRSKVLLINTVGRYIVKWRGKRLRPILLLLSARVAGEPTDNTYRAAAMIELMHTATLIHDDVVDESNIRRGFPTINAIWRNKISVLMGDYLFSKTLIHMISLEDFDALHLLSDTAERLSLGELLQMEKAKTNGMNEVLYYEMIKDKTASLMSTSCELGVITTTKNKEHQIALREYGEKIGMAFQIRDDLFDFIGKEKTVGKPVGKDITHNMITLPLIYALKHATQNESREIRKALMRRKSRRPVEEIIDFVKKYGGVKYSSGIVNKFTREAIQSLSIFPDSPFKDSLIHLAEFNTNRVK